MFAWNTTSWDKASCSNGGANGPLPKLDTHTTGMVSGTKVATQTGWAKVESVTEGQQVLTFDGGLQTVVAVTRHVLMADLDCIASWPMVVPSGALGNREDMTILPHQSVMIESDTADEMTGDPFAVIPAMALDGFRGITQSRPCEWVEIIQLHFAQDEIVFANIGALFMCHAQVDLMSDAAPSPYDVLPFDVAQDLVDCMMLESDYRTPAQSAQYATA